MVDHRAFRAVPQSPRLSCTLFHSASSLDGCTCHPQGDSPRLASCIRENCPKIRTPSFSHLVTFPFHSLDGRHLLPSTQLPLAYPYTKTHGTKDGPRCERTDRRLDNSHVQRCLMIPHFSLCARPGFVSCSKGMLRFRGPSCLATIVPASRSSDAPVKLIVRG